MPAIVAFFSRMLICDLPICVAPFLWAGCVDSLLDQSTDEQSPQLSRAFAVCERGNYVCGKNEGRDGPGVLEDQPARITADRSALPEPAQ